GKQRDTVPKIAYLLEHQYSPAGLSFSGLKNGDAALGKVLMAAGQKAGLAVHLAIVHIEESGAAELTYDYEPSYRRSKWQRYDDDEEEGSDESESANADF